MKTVRIFVSSPGDVQAERDVAGRVVRSMAGEFAGRVEVDGYFWEYEPMVVTSDFQDQIPPPSEFDIVVCILWSRLGSRLHTKHHRPDGTPYSSGTEYEFEDAAAANRAKGSPDILLYVNRTPPPLRARSRAERDEALRQIDALEDFLDRWTRDMKEGAWKGAFTGYTDLARFEKLLEEHLRRLLARRSPPATIHEPVVPATWRGGSPFRGLEPFEYEHAPVFFGRTRAIEDAIKTLRRRQQAGDPPFLLVSGMSGSGKSSLARAGILPLLTRPGVIEGTGVWRHAVMRPGVDAPAALDEALAAAGVGGGPGDSAVRVGAFLDRACAEQDAAGRSNLEARIAEYASAGRSADADRCRALLGGLKPVVGAFALVVDQLEELLAQDGDRRGEFLRALHGLIGTGRVWVVATIRADCFPSLREVPQLLELCGGDGVMTLMPPDRAAIGQMIRRPALAAGLAFEVDGTSGERLDEVLRDAALENPACLPLLQFTLEELHRRRRPPGILTLEACRALGGIEGAVGRRAEEVFLSLPDGVRAALPVVLRAVSDVDAEGGVRRCWVPEEALGADGQAARLAAALVEARLLVRDAGRGGGAVVSVAHESLFHAWPRAAEWCADNAEFLRLRARVRAAADAWDGEGRTADFLLPDGKPLADAVALLETCPADLDARTTAFVRASVSRARARRGRALRRVAAVAVVLAVLAVFAGAAALFGFSQRNRAEARAAELRRALAESDAQLAAGLIASGSPDRALAPLARAMPSDPGAAWRAASLLASRGWFLPDGPAAVLDGPVRSVTVSPEGNLFAVAGDKGTARIFDAATGDPRGPPLVHGGAIWKMDFAPGAALLATASEDGTARLWRTDDGSPVGPPLVHPEGVTDLAFTNGGVVTVCAGTGGGASLHGWDVATGVPTFHVTIPNAEITAFAPGPGGRVFAAGMLDGGAAVWRASDGVPVFEAPPAGAGIEAIAFDPSGKSLAIAAADGSARVFHPNDPDRPPLELGGQGEPVNAIAFSPDGSLLVTADAGGSVRLWSADTGSPVREFPAGGFVQDAVFSPDGRQILTLSQFPSRESSVIGGTLRLWDAASGDELATPLAAAWPVHDVAFFPDGTRLLAGSYDGTAEVLGIATPRPAEPPAGFPPVVHLLADGGSAPCYAGRTPEGSVIGVPGRWSEGVSSGVSTLVACPGADVVAAGLDDGSVLVRRIADGSPSLPAIGLPRRVALVALSPDATRLAAIPETNDAEPCHVTVAGKGSPTLDLPHADCVRDAVFSPDGRLLLTACNDAFARIWDLTNAKPILEIPHEGMVFSVDWSPCGTRVLTASDDAAGSSAQVRNAGDGTPVGERMDGVGGGGARFSPDGTTVVTWNSSARPRVWDAASGTAIGRPLPHDGTLRPEFVGNGRFLVTASSPVAGLLFDNTPHGIGVWDAETGLPLLDFIPTSGTTTHTTSPQAGKIYLADESGVRAVPLPPPGLPPDWLVPRALATGRWQMQEGGSLGRVPSPQSLWRQSRPDGPDPWQAFLGR